MTKEQAKEIRTPVVIRGTGVGRGVAIGPLKFGPMKAERRLRRIEETLSLLERSAEKAKEEIKALEEKAVKSVGEEHGEIFRIHLSVLEDEELLGVIRSFIEEGESLPKAVELARARFAEIAEKVGGRPERARAAHVREASELLLSASEDIASQPKEPIPDRDRNKLKTDAGEKYILVCFDCDTGFVRAPENSDDIIGIVCVGGSESSGLAAYAKARGIPAIVLSNANAPSVRLEGSGAIIDSERGRLTVNPDLAALDRFTESAREAEQTEQRLSSLIGLPSVTRSGQHVAVLATVDSLEGVASALAADAEGIGLFKADGELDSASEEEQFSIYKKALETFKGKPMTITVWRSGAAESGLKGVRALLSDRELFKQRLRSILRAATGGEISVAIPTAISAEELRRVKAVMLDTVGDLKSVGLAFSDRIRLGVIIDTPAAAVCAELIAPEVDFFLADTDSLSVLTLDADRRDPSVTEIIKKNPEPVLRLISHASRAIHASGKGKLMGVTGDLATDPTLTEHLVSLGVDLISVPPPFVLETRERIRQCP